MIFVFLLLILVAAAIALVVVRSSMLRAGLVSHALNLQLIAVRFAQVTPEKEPSIQQIREKIALM
ncbi:MAG: hypothetical protein AAB968_01645, partial [Patescibacteria group bacterium]